MYSDTITLFNRHRDKVNGDTWWPTVLYGVDFNADRAAIVAKYGEQSADNARLHVKYTMQDGNIMVGGKRYLPPKEWDRAGDYGQSVTFSSGDDFDFIYKGEWSEEPIEDNAYGIDGFYGEMNKNYDFVFAITSAARYSVIPHFEILAK